MGENICSPFSWYKDLFSRSRIKKSYNKRQQKTKVNNKKQTVQFKNEQRHEETFLQKRCTNGQQTLEKTLNILVMPSSVVSFPSCLQSFPASGSFQMSQLFTSKYWSFSFSIIPSSVHPGLISLGLIGWISLQSKGLSKVFYNTTVQKHQFFGAQLSSQSNSHIHTWPLEKP